MGKYYLSEKIGDPILMVAPAAHATDLVATDHTGVPVRDAEGILFILSAGVMTGDTADVAITFSSDGIASNASASTTVWASSDMAFAQVTSDSENSLFLLDLKIGNRVTATALNNADAKFFCTGDGVGDGIYQLIGIPYNLARHPTTNAQTVLLR